MEIVDEKNHEKGAKSKRSEIQVWENEPKRQALGVLGKTPKDRFQDDMKAHLDTYNRLIAQREMLEKEIKQWQALCMKNTKKISEVSKEISQTDEKIKAVSQAKAQSLKSTVKNCLQTFTLDKEELASPRYEAMKAMASAIVTEFDHYLGQLIQVKVNAGHTTEWLLCCFNQVHNVESPLEVLACALKTDSKGHWVNLSKYGAPGTKVVEKGNGTLEVGGLTIQPEKLAQFIFDKGKGIRQEEDEEEDYFSSLAPSYLDTA
jgi:hypothetical protein